MRETAATGLTTGVQIAAMETAWAIGAPPGEVALEAQVPSVAVPGDQAGTVHVPAVRAAHRAWVAEAVVVVAGAVAVGAGGDE